GEASLHPALARKNASGCGAALGACRQIVFIAGGGRGIRQRHPPLWPHRPSRHRCLSFPTLRQAADRGIFWGTLGGRARGGRRPCIRCLRDRRTGGLTSQRLRPAREAASPSSLGRRSILPRLLPPCPPRPSRPPTPAPRRPR